MISILRNWQIQNLAKALGFLVFVAMRFFKLLNSVAAHPRWTQFTILLKEYLTLDKKKNSFTA